MEDWFGFAKGTCHCQFWTVKIHENPNDDELILQRSKLDITFGIPLTEVEAFPHAGQFLQALQVIFQANNFGLKKNHQSPSFFIKDVDLPAAILLR